MTEPEDTSFDPRKIASGLIKSKLGNLQTPTTKGTLFSRTSEGKTRITGLEDSETKQALSQKAAKVKEILGLS